MCFGYNNEKLINTPFFDCYKSLEKEQPIKSQFYSTYTYICYYYSLSSFLSHLPSCLICLYFFGCSRWNPWKPSGFLQTLFRFLKGKQAVESQHQDQGQLLSPGLPSLVPSCGFTIELMLVARGFPNFQSSLWLFISGLNLTIKCLCCDIFRILEVQFVDKHRFRLIGSIFEHHSVKLVFKKSMALHQHLLILEVSDRWLATLKVDG